VVGRAAFLAPGKLLVMIVVVEVLCGIVCAFKYWRLAGIGIGAFVLLISPYAIWEAWSLCMGDEGHERRSDDRGGKCPACGHINRVAT